MTDDFHWRLVDPTHADEEDADGLDKSQPSKSLRPQRLSEFIGQEKLCENLSMAIRAASKRGEALDHVLLHGPPGLGKTTLAEIIARESNVGFKATSGPVLERAGDLAAILSSLSENDVLFIDEIHRLGRVIEEVLYPAMEDFKIDIMIGSGPSARSVQLDLKPFTLVGATTRTGLLSSPLRDRFGIVERIEFYSAEELALVVNRSAQMLRVELTEDGSFEVAKRSRGTPRIANRLLRRVRDFAEDRSQQVINATIAEDALSLLEIDKYGLDKMDRLLLSAIVQTFRGGPVGVETLAATLHEDKDTIMDVYEPFLLQEGFLQRTSRGRVATQKAFEYLQEGAGQ